MINLLEAIMIFCWGLSWPISIHKSYTSRTAKGKSIVFEVFILIGYICGIIRKSLQVSQGIALDWIFILGFVFYFINMTAVIIDMCLWVRNHHLDIMRHVNLFTAKNIYCLHSVIDFKTICCRSCKEAQCCLWMKIHIIRK